MTNLNSKIEWTDVTWSPVVGCTHVSPGCDNCYAARLASGRLRHQPTYAGLAEGGRFNGTVRQLPDRLDQPLRWRKPRRVFVNSMSDLFHEKIEVGFIAQVFAVMSLAEQHTFQVLTKRHGRLRSLLSEPTFRVLVDDYRAKYRPGCGDFVWPLPKVWLGVSAENQRWADIRIPALMQTPAAIRFVSAEPLLGPINFHHGLTHCPTHDFSGGFCVGYCPDRIMPNWVITGGESGPGARLAYASWFRSIRDQCQAAGVAYFHKQNGQKRYGRELDGRTWDQFPQAVTP